MTRRPPRSTLPDPLLPSTTLFLSLGARLSRERRRRQTIRELSAIPDALLSDVGIARAEIPAVAAALVDAAPVASSDAQAKSEEHTSELQSLMRISYAVFCLKKTQKSREETTTKQEQDST